MDQNNQSYLPMILKVVTFKGKETQCQWATNEAVEPDDPTRHRSGDCQAEGDPMKQGRNKWLRVRGKDSVDGSCEVIA